MQPMADANETQTDIAAARCARLLADLLDHATPPWRPGMLPPLGHWLLFPPLARQSTMGEDGHPRRVPGGILPDDAPPRRMWAGSRVRFVADIPLGSTVVRETTLAAATPKQGRSGAMLFVTLRHRLSVADVPVLEEEQDIVYREMPVPDSSARPAAPPARAPLPPIHRTMTADPVQLFRYSALTHNGHRIHYDRDYATGVERYPGLVVQGPYLATLLMDHFLRSRSGAWPASFAFRALRPVFDMDPFTLGLAQSESGADLVVIGADGGVAMQAEIGAADQPA